MEEFILDEETSSRDRRKKARLLEASVEKRLAAEVAQLKGLRLKASKAQRDEELREKVSNAEKAYINRKMVYAKSAQVAGAELRLQVSPIVVNRKTCHCQNEIKLTLP